MVPPCAGYETSCKLYRYVIFLIAHFSVGRRDRITGGHGRLGRRLRVRTGVQRSVRAALGRGGARHDLRHHRSVFSLITSPPPFTASTSRAHLCRAALDAVCCQASDLLHAINVDCGGAQLTSLHADGGMTINSLLCRTLADVLDVRVTRATQSEATAFGAAIAAALAANVWTLHNVNEFHIEHTDYEPTASTEWRNALLHDWHMAVERSLHWAKK